MVAGLALDQLAWTSPHGAPISVRLLQGNVPQEMKFNPETASDTLALYHEMLTEARADLIATPETALPMMAQRCRRITWNCCRPLPASRRATCWSACRSATARRQYANSLLGLGAGRVAQLPLRQAPPGALRRIHPARLSLVRRHDAYPAGRLHARRAGAGAVRAVKDQWVLPNICYEDLFGEEIADQIAASYLPAGRSRR